MNILSLSLDHALLDIGSMPNDAQRRQLAYLRELQQHRPGSRLIVLVRPRTRSTAVKIRFAEGLQVCSTAAGALGFLSSAYRQTVAIHARSPLSLIMSQSPFVDGLVAFALSRRTGVPWLCQLHMPSLDNVHWLAERPWNRVRARLAMFLLRRADAVRVVSARAAEWLRLLSIADQRVFVIPVGVAETTKPVQRQEVSRAVLFVGRLAPEKGLSVLLRAFAHLRTECSDARLIIVGDGPLRDRLQTWAERLQLQEAVEWCGWVQPEQLPSFYRSAGVVVLPSLYEAYGRVIVEAMSFGVPVVASATDGASELVQNGVTGLLVPVGDVRALAQGLKALLADVALNLKMGDAARNAARARPRAADLCSAQVQMWLKVARQ